jgi:hypothetical protein
LPAGTTRREAVARSRALGPGAGARIGEEPREGRQRAPDQEGTDHPFGQELVAVREGLARREAGKLACSNEMPGLDLAKRDQEVNGQDRRARGDEGPESIEAKEGRERESDYAMKAKGRAAREDPGGERQANLARARVLAADPPEKIPRDGSGANAKKSSATLRLRSVHNTHYRCEIARWAR